jgi:pimeloyl-ACP methyl ester carboxylesterase
MSDLGPSFHERPLAFGAPASLVGILTRPTRPAAVQDGADRPAVLFLNAGILHRVGPNRMHVELARALAGLGIMSLRFDLAGIGDSPARTDGLPLGDGVRLDVDAALSELRAAGARRVVVFGLCAGADNALRTATRHEDVVGLVLLDPTVFRTPGWYVRRALPQLMDPQAWRRWARHPKVRDFVDRLRGAAPEAQVDDAARPEYFYTGLRTREEVEQHLAVLLPRRVQLFYAFSGGWADLYNYESQLLDNHPTLDFRGRLRLRHYPSADHTYSRRVERARLYADLLSWFSGAPFPP